MGDAGNRLDIPTEAAGVSFDEVIASWQDWASC